MLKQTKWLGLLLAAVRRRTRLRRCHCPTSSPANAASGSPTGFTRRHDYHRWPLSSKPAAAIQRRDQPQCLPVQTLLAGAVVPPKGARRTSSSS